MSTYQLERSSAFIARTKSAYIFRDHFGAFAIINDRRVHGDEMDELVGAWLRETIIAPYKAKRGYEDPDDWTLS